MKRKLQSKEKGTFAELHAAAYLRRKGCMLLARNYAYRGGEIDIIAQDTEGRIIFAEVKSSWKIGKEPLYRLSRKKQFRIWRTACHYLHHHADSNHLSRFDALLIHIQNFIPHIKHYPGAFESAYVIPMS
ncbi:MAG: YraN family protein [Fibrobacter sp.]|jgi:putative endonuclease|nr:YraN family protein [Fibrobacter sp.]